MIPELGRSPEEQKGYPLQYSGLENSQVSKNLQKLEAEKKLKPTNTFDITIQSSYMLGTFIMDFPGGSGGKESACNVGDLGLIPGLGRSPGEGKGYPLQYSGLENSIDYTGRHKEPDMTE